MRPLCYICLLIASFQFLNSYIILFWLLFCFKVVKFLRETVIWLKPCLLSSCLFKKNISTKTNNGRNLKFIACHKKRDFVEFRQDPFFYREVKFSAISFQIRVSILTLNIIGFNIEIFCMGLCYAKLMQIV